MNELSDAPGQTRRIILKSAVGLAAFALGAGGVLTSAYAAIDPKSWPENAFKQKSEADALKALYGKSGEASDKVNLDAPASLYLPGLQLADPYARAPPPPRTAPPIRRRSHKAAHLRA